ncbi:MAG TPA: hypothetical protein VFB78_05640 [Acidimicrobiales bacterium]|nr:hypothetical protein [Acidimicrobiales bacterium]
MGNAARPDWHAWHAPYDVPGSELHTRLHIVQRCVRDALDAAPAGPIAVISACAGQGRDLIPVVAEHARRADVIARLVELDPRNADIARAAAADAGLVPLTVVTGDAGTTSAYAGSVPANLVLFCGIWGNVTDADVEHSIGALPTLCAPGAIVIWTRHRQPPDLTVSIRRWLDASGFTEVSFDAPDGMLVTVGAHRLDGPPAPFRTDQRLFTFVDA